MTAKGQELVGESSCPVARLKDLFNRSLQIFIKPGRFYNDITAAVDNGQQIIKGMGYTAGQSADRFHLLGLQELFLDMALSGDILYDVGDANRLIFLIEKTLGCRDTQPILSSAGCMMRNDNDCIELLISNK